MSAITPRKDVARNRALILVAAHQIFSTHGVEAPLDLIVEMAQVGRGTLYRHFPDRTALLTALFDEEVERLFAALTSHPLDRQIEAFITQIAGSAERSPALSEAWRSMPANNPEMRAARTRLKEKLQVPLEAAIAAKRLRPMVTAESVLLAARMIGGALRSAPEGDRADQAALAVVLYGLLEPRS